MHIHDRARRRPDAGINRQHRARMEPADLLAGLNPAQREAVTATPGPLRVLTSRVAWLIDQLRVHPAAVLAVTFTNKAAREMRGRIETLLQMPCGGLWLGTFHGLCHRLLRQHFEAAGLPQNFEIMDSDDQYRLLRAVLRELQLDEARWPPRQIQWTVNQYKEAGLRAHQVTVGQDAHSPTLQRIYAEYEARCQRSGAVDFAELLLRGLELLRKNQPLRTHYQARFEHILVDEFQDTNLLQYQWLKLLCAGHQRLFAVGDDDQSIYGWRGAKVENLLSFERDFPAAGVVRLEQNYRSSGHILQAANAIIAHNRQRMGKNLWTEAGDGAPIRVYAASNEIDEAKFVVEQIQTWLEQAGRQRAHVAILYRSNAQSRVFEGQLAAARMPYRVYGGLRFFERAEIKHALAYLRLLNNRHADQAFERVVNLPTRGIGSKTLETVRELARNEQVSLWQAATQCLDSDVLGGRAAALSGFLQLIERLAADCHALELADIVDQMLQHSGLLACFKDGSSERAQTQVENLEELINAARQFDPDDVIIEADANATAADTSLSLFLTHAALEAGEGQAEEWQDCVQLMSLHSAKGLEFPLVFLCGMEEGLFPHQRALEEAGQLQEERRLCYVGMTRAMQQLVLCHAEIRRLYGREHYARPSRFLAEIPPETVTEVRSHSFRPAHRHNGASIRPVHRYRRTTGTVPAAQPDEELPAELRPGGQVRHKKFGDGVVVGLEGRGQHTRVQVNFERVGVKWLVASYANLEAV